MKEFFSAIQDLFESVLFAPFNVLRETELENWWVSVKLSSRSNIRYNSHRFRRHLNRLFYRR